MTREPAPSTSIPRRRGTIKAWFVDRRYGFVTLAESAGAFVRLSDFLEPRPPEAELRVGDLVEYTLVTTPRGPRAIRATLVKAAEAP